MGEGWRPKADRWLSYKTLRFALIQDHRLGALHWTFFVGVCVYIILYAIIIDGGYLRYHEVSGSARVFTRQPLVNGTISFPGLDPTAVPYCTQSSDAYDGRKLNCKSLDIDDETFPPAAAGFTFIPTRVSKTVFSNTCGTGSHPSINCWSASASEDFYVSGIEDYLVSFTGSASSDSADISGDSLSLDGLMDGCINPTTVPALGINESVWSQHDPSCPAAGGRHGSFCLSGGQRDSFPLAFLVAGASYSPSAPGSSCANPVSLDTKGDSTEATTFSDTFRYSGMTLLVEIEFTNWKPFNGFWSRLNHNKKWYRYRVFRLPQVDGVRRFTTMSQDTQTRTVYDTHGVYLVFQVSGKFGKFDFTALLVSLTTSLSLLAVATVIVDFLMLHLLPQKKEYSQFKYEKSQAFTSYREAEAEEQRLDRDAEFIRDQVMSVLSLRDEDIDPGRFRGKKGKSRRRKGRDNSSSTTRDTTTYQGTSYDETETTATTASIYDYGYRPAFSRKNITGWDHSDSS